MFEAAGGMLSARSNSRTKNATNTFIPDTTHTGQKLLRVLLFIACRKDRNIHSEISMDARDCNRLLTIHNNNNNNNDNNNNNGSLIWDVT